MTLFQSGAWYKAIDMKIIFHIHTNKTKVLRSIIIIVIIMRILKLGNDPLLVYITYWFTRRYPEFRGFAPFVIDPKLLMNSTIC